MGRLGGAREGHKGVEARVKGSSDGSGTGEAHARWMQACRRVFENKMGDYGMAWLAMRASSLTDMLLIKVGRIRSVQEKGAQKVDEDMSEGFVAVVNYSMMALLRHRLPLPEGIIRSDLKFAKELLARWKEEVEVITRLLQDKNHDYAEVWRDMRLSTLIDIILMKVLRIRRMEENSYKARVSEGVLSVYRDIVNYAVFCLIKREDEEGEK